jgi:hypothetical protein
MTPPLVQRRNGTTVLVLLYRRKMTDRKQCKMLSSVKIYLFRDFAAGVYLSVAPSPPRLLFGVV